MDAYRVLDKVPICLVLDNIRSGLNVGSIFRTADAFALQSIHLCGITARPPQREILKTAIGATDSVSWDYHPEVSDCIEGLISNGYHIIGVEQTDMSTSLRSFHFHGQSPVALVFGNEVGGLSESILPYLDDCVEVPQYGTKHSLNVAVCAGIVIWHLFPMINLGRI